MTAIEFVYNDGRTECLRPIDRDEFEMGQTDELYLFHVGCWPWKIYKEDVKSYSFYEEDAR